MDAFTYDNYYNEAHLMLFTLNTNSQYYTNVVESLTKPTRTHTFAFIAIYRVMILYTWESFPFIL